MNLSFIKFNQTERVLSTPFAGSAVCIPLKDPYVVMINLLLF